MTSSGKQGEGRGFAGMDEQKQREIASKGGKAAHEKGTAHESQARSGQQETGRQGGNQSREHMSDIGRKGGQH